MKFIPDNRHLMVRPIEEEKDENVTIMLPADYAEPISPYVLCEVEDIAVDSKFINDLKKGDIVLVERRMLHKVEIDNKSIYLILENYSYGRVKYEADWKYY